MIKVKRIFEIPILYENWILVYLNRLGLIHLSKLTLRNGLIFKLRKNAPIKSQSRARSIVSFVFSQKGYDIFRKIRKGDIVIDIGAFIGDFTIKAAKNGARVYAFEPAKKTFDLLRENVTLNKCDNYVTLYNKGIFSKKQKGVLNIHQWEGVNSMVDCAWLNNESKTLDKENIELISMDDVFRENNLTHCNFLKIDCEGVEAEIVMSLSKNILNKVEYISMESTDYLSSEKNSKLISFLKGNGFELKIFDEGLEKRVKGGDIIRIFAKNKKFNKK